MNADLKKHGLSTWGLVLCSLGLVLPFAPQSFAGPIGPLVKEVKFRRIIPAGTGCPQGTSLVYWDGDDELFDSMRLVFDAFQIESEGTKRKDAHKYCEMLIHFEYPEKYGLTVTVTRLEAETSVSTNVIGRMEAQVSTERQGPEDKAPVERAWTTIEIEGGWYGLFSEYKGIKVESLQLPCGMKRPLVFRVTRSFWGQSPIRSYMMHEAGRSSSFVDIKLDWRKCGP